MPTGKRNQATMAAKLTHLAWSVSHRSLLSSGNSGTRQWPWMLNWWANSPTLPGRLGVQEAGSADARVMKGPCPDLSVPGASSESERRLDPDFQV